MGGSISKMMAKIFGSKEMRLLMLGLDAAGKTSMFAFPLSTNDPSRAPYTIDHSYYIRKQCNQALTNSPPSSQQSSINSNSTKT